jgi:hypothetical protein
LPPGIVAAMVILARRRADLRRRPAADRRTVRPAAAALPLVHADYPLCVTVNPGPLQPNKPQPDFRRRKGDA